MTAKLAGRPTPPERDLTVGDATRLAGGERPRIVDPFEWNGGLTCSCGAGAVATEADGPKCATCLEREA